jgi:hypothetical protein
VIARALLRVIQGGRSRRVLLEKLNQMEIDDMNDHATTAETESPSAPLSPQHQKMLDALSWTCWDLRLAAALNFLEVARAQGGQRDWTDQHAAQIRAMMGIGDAVVAGDASAIVPSGFGEPIRTRQADALRAALAAVKLPVAAPLEIAAGEEAAT